MNLRWLISSRVRHASSMWKHVRNMLNGQRDILGWEPIKEVEKSLAELDEALKSGADKFKLDSKITELESAANKWLKPYPNPVWRENVEVLLVALAVAMGIRTFFAQPFKIPTGSMQPTLFGVTSENLIDRPELNFPTGLDRVREWLAGISYIEVKAKADGKIERVDKPVGIRVVDFYQTFYLGGVAHTIYMPPDFGSPPGGTLETRAGWLDQNSGRPTEQGTKLYHRGDVVARFKVQAGDHLFVDRLTYNFRKPTRGEIVVFSTAGIEEYKRSQWRMPDDQFYIKRMVALGDEKVKIGDDHHLIINGNRLDEKTAHFEKVYGSTAEDLRDGYSGHLPMILFANGNDFQVRSNHFLVMGDNTGNSLDSRFFGDVDMDYIIGKELFVYWPLSKRFGWGHR
ncbi:MAG: signal peptidase I [Verrucomicrobia bacterium]|nr:signal peptidase I [Verrucomicrobiota bacterium]